MADIVLNSAQRYSGIFLGSNIDEKEDLLSPHKIFGISHHASQDKKQISAVGSVAFGSDVTFRLPSGNYISDIYIVATLGALTSGNYSTYPGLNLVQRMDVKHNGKQLQHFDYEPVAHDCLNRMHDEQVVQVLELAGGTSFASGSCVVPLPIFFSRFAFGMKENNYTHPLNTHILKGGDIEIILTLRTAANLAASGATVGSPTISLSMYVVYNYTEDILKQKHKDEQYIYKGVDFSTYEYPTAIATATSTEIDISQLKGNLKQLKIFDKLVSDIDTAHAYYLNKDTISDLKLKMDGNIYYESNHNYAVKWDRLSVGSELRSATILNGALIPFSLSYDQKHFTGSYPTSGSNKLTCILTHQLGANGYIRFCARKHVFYVLDDYGNLVRQE